MDLQFNELSGNPLAGDLKEGYARVFLFLDTFKRAKDWGYNRIRFETPSHVDILSDIRVTESDSLSDFRSRFLANKELRRYGDLLLGLPRRPYLDEDSEEEIAYINCSFTLNKGGKEVEPFGLASAYLRSTLAIGFNSEAFWDQCMFEIIVEGSISASVEKVFCVSRTVHFDDQALVTWQSQQAIQSIPQDEGVYLLFSDYNFESKAREDILFWKYDHFITQRLIALLFDIKTNPLLGGLGKTESLKKRTDVYSKRIDYGNRLIYKVEGDYRVTVLSCRGHYD